MKYERYKDSGIEWIGEIPEHWEILKLGRVFDFIRTGLNPRENFSLGHGDNYYVTIKSIVEGNLILDDNCDFIDNDALRIIQNRSKLRVGDILFPSIGADNLSYLILSEPINWNINESVFAITPNRKYVISKYLLWTLNSKLVSDQIEFFSTGSTFRSIKQNQLTKMSISVPPLQEQGKIASYLDSTTSKIDAIIQSLEEQRDQLEQYKRELISETVTKGLDKNVPMKNSGTDWIGQIPEHWKIYPLFYLFEQNKDKNDGMKNSNLLSLSYGSIVRKDIDTTFGLLPASFEGYQVVDNGYIILRLTDLQNDKRSLRTGLVREKGIITSAYVGLKKSLKDLNSEYLHYVLHTYDLKKVFYSMGSGLRQSLNFSDIKRVPLLFPPLEEQLEIVGYLNRQQVKIDSIMRKIDLQIEELREYRKIIIHEAVTGKRKVVGGAE